MGAAFVVSGAAGWAAGCQVASSTSSVPGTVEFGGGRRTVGWGQECTGRAALSTLRCSRVRATLCSLMSPAPLACSTLRSQGLIGRR